MMFTVFTLQQTLGALPKKRAAVDPHKWHSPLHTGPIPVWLHVSVSPAFPFSPLEELTEDPQLEPRSSQPEWKA